MKSDRICPVCKGSGRELHPGTEDNGKIVKKRIICELCKGKGVLPLDKLDTSCTVKNYYDVCERKTLLDYLFSEIEEDEFY